MRGYGGEFWANDSDLTDRHSRSCCRRLAASRLERPVAAGAAGFVVAVSLVVGARPPATHLALKG